MNREQKQQQQQKRSIKNKLKKLAIISTKTSKKNNNTKTKIITWLNNTYKKKEKKRKEERQNQVYLNANLSPKNKHKMSSTTNRPVLSESQATSKQARLVEKLVSDLEDLCAKIADVAKTSHDLTVRDDCYELHKFCTKLEFLLQMGLKEKKSLLSASSLNSSNLASNGDNSAQASFKLVNTEYWSFIVDVLKASRGFQDAIKYVKGLNEVKTNFLKIWLFILNFSFFISNFLTRKYSLYSTKI